MNQKRLKTLLQSLKMGKTTVEEALEALKHYPFEAIEGAHIDHHRSLRKGFPEVIYGEGKSAAQIGKIMEAMARQGENILVTRLDAGKATAVRKKFPKAVFYPDARVLTLLPNPLPPRGRGTVLVVCAGTSDIPVAEEARITAEVLGNPVATLYDVGVAGLHRLLSQHKTLTQAAVIIVVAGMEGALPSVVGGLVDKPVVAVPTSVGYGASFGGISALLAMLNSCASGVGVVNIDNGFGAAFLATLINRL